MVGLKGFGLSTHSDNVYSSENTSSPEVKYVHIVFQPVMSLGTVSDLPVKAFMNRKEAQKFSRECGFTSYVKDVELV